MAMLLSHPAISLQGYLFSRPVPAGNLLPLLEQLPAHCRELKQSAQKLQAQAQPVTRAGDRRRGSLSLVVD
jgi:EAL domain-containing protein (putative c-di-GMP-specific phosphodiesterase class I)